MLGPRTDGVLYHYTSQHTLLSIVETKRLRISNVYYMNDANEIRYGAALLKSIMADRHDRESDAVVKEFLAEFKEWLNQLTGIPHQVFVFSLTANGNLLSQWRAYTPRGGVGVSIGFSKDPLEASARARGFTLVECVYDTTRQSEILNGLLDSILRTFADDCSSLDVSRQPSNQKYSEYLYKHSAELLGAFCRLKDHYFQEEREWRLISPHYEKYTHPHILFRAGPSTLVPYIEYDLTGIHPDGRLFEQVYVGPSSQLTLAYPAIQHFLSNKGACNVVLNSGSPLRDL